MSSKAHKYRDILNILDTWLVPREGERPQTLGDPMPAEVHRDLAGILRDATPAAHVWRPTSQTFDHADPAPVGR
jgi:hypothetical protein